MGEHVERKEEQLLTNKTTVVATIGMKHFVLVHLATSLCKGCSGGTFRFKNESTIITVLNFKVNEGGKHLAHFSLIRGMKPYIQINPTLQSSFFRHCGAKHPTLFMQS